MRTTLTLDDDVVVLLEKAQANRKAPMKAVVNDALRAGLAEIIRPPAKAKPFRTKTLIRTPPRIPLRDNVWELVALAEGEAHK
jgi:hypothetical protein